MFLVLINVLMKGALLLSNTVSVVVHDLEQKRVDCLKTQEKIRKEKEKKSKVFKVGGNLISRIASIAQMVFSFSVTGTAGKREK